MISAHDYYKTVVIPNVSEFCSNNKDIRLALNASTTTLHVVDYVMQIAEKNSTAADHKVSQFCDAAAGRNFSFCVVRGFALASKHCRLSKQSLEGFHSGEHMIAYPSFAGIMRCGASFIGGTVGGITIHWKAQQFVNFTNALKEVLQFFEAEFPELTQENTPVLSDQFEGG